MDCYGCKFNDVGCCIHEDAEEFEDNPFGVGSDDCDGFEED